MGKRKKKNKKKQAPKVAKPVTEETKVAAVEPVAMPIEEPKQTDSENSSTETEVASDVNTEANSAAATEEKAKEESHLSAVEEKLNHDIQTKSRIQRMLPDIIRVALAFSVIGIGTAIWWKPPLMTASFPVTTFTYKDDTVKEATLYRPLAMPERYYVQLPYKIAKRYEWFAIDRRREVVALTEKPEHTFLGNTAIKRTDPLGLDLEFRKLDGFEWLIHFNPDSIVFSNNLLCVRLDTGQAEAEEE